MLSCEMRKDDNMIKLWEKDVPGYNKNYGNEPDMMPYIIEDGKVHGAVIVVPGGGYVMRAPHEGEPIALWLNKIGLSAFVLNYRVAPYRYPCSYYDAQRAIRIVRCNAKNWNIDPDRIGILGFSAGAHLAATAATYFDDGIKDSSDEIDSFSSRPDALVLCYPVITFGKYSHLGSVIALLGDNPDEKLIKKLSLENAVTKNTPRHSYGILRMMRACRFKTLFYFQKLSRKTVFLLKLTFSEAAVTDWALPKIIPMLQFGRNFAKTG